MPEPHTPKRAPQGTAEGFLKRPRHPYPTRPVSWVSPGRRHRTEVPAPSGAAQGPTLGGRGGRAPKTLAGAQASPTRPAPRPQASASTRERPRPGEALLSPSPASLPCVGLGAGRQEGVGANEPSGGGGDSGSSSSSSSRNLRGNNKATPSETRELGRRCGGGEESRAVEGGKDRSGSSLARG